MSISFDKSGLPGTGVAVVFTDGDGTTKLDHEIESSDDSAGRLVAWVKAAGKSSESDSARDGFLSYAHESHSVGDGVALGFAIVAAHAGFPIVLGAVLTALGGVQASRFRFGNARVMEEITDEPQYFLPSIAVGGVIGAIVFGIVAIPAIALLVAI